MGWWGIVQGFVLRRCVFVFTLDFFVGWILWRALVLGLVFLFFVVVRFGDVKSRGIGGGCGLVTPGFEVLVLGFYCVNE